MNQDHVIEFVITSTNGYISVPRMNHEFDEAALVLGALLPVISSAARNLGPKTKISQSPPFTFVQGWLHRNDKS